MVYFSIEIRNPIAILRSPIQFIAIFFPLHIYLTCDFSTAGRSKFFNHYIMQILKFVEPKKYKRSILI